MAIRSEPKKKATKITGRHVRFTPILACCNSASALGTEESQDAFLVNLRNIHITAHVFDTTTA